jgi:hypothetical protein
MVIVNLEIVGNCWLCKRQSFYHITRVSGPKWPKMAKNGQKWPKMAKNGQKWSKMAM